MITFETRYLRYSIAEDGTNAEFTDLSTGRNLLKPGPNPCGRLVLGEKDRAAVSPESVSYDAPRLTVTYPGGYVFTVVAEETPEYLTFSLESCAREDFWTVTAALIAVDIDYAAASPFVASLLALTLNTRMQEYPGRNSVLLAEAYTHVGWKGAACAVIGAPEPELNGIMRRVVGSIPDGAMPKAAYSGPFAPDCPDAGRTYSIATDPITLANVDDYIVKMKKFGITQVNLHQGTMYTQGDFTVNPAYYPGGLGEFKAVIRRLHENGMQVMLHSYAFFVQTMSLKDGNRYVAPVPHRDLGVCERFTLAEDIPADAGFIPTKEDVSRVDTVSGIYIRQSTLLWVDDEIIRFAQADEKGFSRIERGVYGTAAAAHRAGSELRQLNSYFGCIAPEKNSGLFREIARNTADFYNECDFDGFYLDAIDGALALDGHEFSWYHAVAFINEIFKYLKKPPVFNCCYGPQYPGQWYARTRMGAFDTPRRGWRDFTDEHIKFNEKFAERMYLVSELGWWDLFPGDAGNTLGWSRKIMFDEDVDYICSKMLATDACQCWRESFEQYREIPVIASYAGKITLYTRLKDEKYFSKAVKDIVRRPYSEFGLVQTADGYRFRRTHTDMRKLENLDDERGTYTVVNRFGPQAPKLRIEALYAAEDYDSPGGLLLGGPSADVPLKRDAEWQLDHFDTKGRRGVGVRIRGDGKGETVRIRLRAPEYTLSGNADFYVKVDFTGWRYFAFYEYEDCEMKHEDWEPQGLDYKIFTDVNVFYAAYYSDVKYDDLDTLRVTVNRGDGFDLRMEPVRILPERAVTLHDPTLTVNGQSVTFRTALKSGTYLEYDPESGKAQVFDLKGFLLDTPEVTGVKPFLNAGENTVTLTAGSTDGVAKRAALTVRTAGELV